MSPKAGSQRIEMLRSGAIKSTLLKLALPAITAMLVGAVYHVVDTMFIGLLGDTPSIGAATVVFPLFMLISSIGLSFGVGAASAVSRYLGANDYEHSHQIASTAFFTCLIVGILFSAIVLWRIEDVLTMFGATPTILDRAVEYGSIIIAGCIFQIINMCMNNLLRAEGAAGYSGAALIIGAGVNILLDPIYMFTFNMGLVGAAYATITAQALSTGFLLLFYVRKRGVVRLHIRYSRPTRYTYHELLKIGVPTFVRQVLASTAMAVMNLAARPFGDEAIAAVGIDVRLIALVMFVFFGMGQGFQPFAGYNYGARLYKRMKTAFKTAGIWSLSIGSGMLIVYWLTAPVLMLGFSRDPEVVRIGAMGLRLASLSLCFVGYQNLTAILFQAMGKGRETMFLAMARQGFFLIPLLLILPGWFGLVGIMISQPIADLLTTFVSQILLVKHNRRLSAEVSEVSE
ncbi:MAG: MATE family efflux transporter [Spirochaetota bacterium]